jgi:branched-chain amino acid transport system permease protein
MEFFAQQLANGIMMGSIYVLIAMGLVIILSMMDIVNFAHGQLAMLGAYVTMLFMNNLGVNFWLGVVITIIVISLVAFIIEKGIIRPARQKKLPLLIAGIATVGLAMTLEEIAVLIFGRTQQTVQLPFGAESITIGIIHLSLMRLLIPLLVLVLVAVLILFLYKNKVGRSLRAVSQDSEAASLLGINVDTAMSLGFVLSVSLAALAGAFLAQMMPINPYMGLSMSLKGFAIIIVGGMMSLKGAIIAGFLLGIGEVMVSGYIGSGYKELFFFAAMVLVLLIRPSGLFGGSE